MRTHFSTIRAVIGTALLLALPKVQAQFAVTWSTLDGGGGMSTGGTFTVAGTIGQAGAGPAASGNGFTLTGGFWSGATNAASQPIPRLAIQRDSGNSVVLSWPASVTGLVLQERTSLAGAGVGWTDVTTPPVTNGTDQEVTLSLAGPTRWFRLIHR